MGAPRRLTVFDRPVARGRIQVRAEEAFLHGAAYLHMVVGPDDAARYETSGWAVAGHLVSFQKK